MKKTLLSLCFAAGMLAAGFNAEVSAQTTANQLTEDLLFYTTLSNVQAAASAGWASDGGTSNSFSGTTKDVNLLPGQGNDNDQLLEATTKVEGVVLKEKSSKLVVLKVLNATKVTAYAVTSSNSDSRCLKATVSDGETTNVFWTDPIAPKTGGKLEIAGLDKEKTYTISFQGYKENQTEYNDVTLYAVKFTAGSNVPQLAIDNDIKSLSYNVMASEKVELSVYSALATSYQWYTSTVPSYDGAEAISGATSASYSPSTATAGIKYYFCVASASGKSVRSSIAQVTVNQYVKSNACDLARIEFENGFDGFIREDEELGNTITAYYLEGTDAPVIANSKVEVSAKAQAYPLKDAIRVIAEDGTEKIYQLSLIPVAPYKGEGLTFDGTESFVKTGYAYDAAKGWRFAKSVNETGNMRILWGYNRLYFFVGASESITLTVASGISSARAVKIYRNGILISELTTPKSSAEDNTITIEGDKTKPYMIAIVSNQTSGDGGFGAISVKGLVTEEPENPGEPEDPEVPEVGANYIFDMASGVGSYELFGTTSMDGEAVKFANGVTADKVYANFLKIVPATGTFMKGDVVTLTGYINNSSDTKTGAISIYENECNQYNVVLASSELFGNIHSKVGQEATSFTYELKSNASALYIGRASVSNATSTYVSDLKVERVEESVNARTVKVSNFGMSTLYLDFDAVIPDGVKAYAAKVNEEYSFMTLTEIKGAIPANTGVVLEAEEGEYEFVEAASAAAVASDLEGTVATKAIEANSTLVLDKVDGKPGFYNFPGTSLSSYKAYLPKLAVAGINGIRVVFESENAETALDVIASADAEDKIYNVNGQLVENMARPGLYIVNGKKVVVK